MSFLKFEFRSEAGSLTAGKYEPYGIVSYEGLDATEYDLEMYGRADGKGERLSRRIRKARTIEIVIEYKRRVIDEIEPERLHLIDFFSPDQDGELYVSRNWSGKTVTRHIRYTVRSFKLKETNIHNRPMATIELICPDPDFLGMEVTESLFNWKDGLRFPFRVPFHMRRSGDLQKEIVNEGSLSTPCYIQFSGPATNPWVRNDTTGEKITVLTELSADQMLCINTKFEEIAVQIQNKTTGKMTDAFHAIDYTSEFFQIRPGKNLLSYGSASAAGAAAEGVTVQYIARYQGI